MHAVSFADSGPKGPPSAPPAIPPIIINPFNRHEDWDTRPPAGDPRPIPVGPPVMPPPGPDWCCPRIIDEIPA